MQNPYLVRTAAAVSVAAAALTAGWMGTGSHTDEMQIEPRMVSVAPPYEPSSGYFPAGYELKPNAAEPEYLDYE
jgi:hypothetical protein